MTDSYLCLDTVYSIAFYIDIDNVLNRINTKVRFENCIYSNILLAPAITGECILPIYIVLLNNRSIKKKGKQLFF